MELPYLTREFAGVGGRIKQRVEDFFVQELPLYEPSGEGEHLYCEIQKVGITTFEAVNRLARALKIPQAEIGYAGMKDARGVTRQLFSIRGASESALSNAYLADMSVLWAAQHGNKLRLGHLAGNRFAVKIREVEPTDVVKLRPVLRVLERRGMPNYFGEQRFGNRGDNDRLGAALIRGDDEALLSLLLGTPQPGDRPEERAAREAFDAGDLEAALARWPARRNLERRVLSALMKTKGAVDSPSGPIAVKNSDNFSSAARKIDKRLRRLWVSALQSRVFNEVLSRRIDSLDRVREGDLAQKHDSGGCFVVREVAAEQPRCDRFEISPTGPLVGYMMSLPEGEPLAIEQEMLRAHELSPGDFRRQGRHKVKGARRALRARPTELELAAGVDEHGAHITVAFTLPAGAFATILLRELMKNDRIGGGQTPDKLI